MTSQYRHRPMNKLLGSIVTVTNNSRFSIALNSDINNVESDTLNSLLIKTSELDDPPLSYCEIITPLLSINTLSTYILY